MVESSDLPRPRRASQTESLALARYGILDTAPEKSFDDLVELVARRFDTPHAALSMVTPARVWLKASTTDPGTSLLPTESFGAVVAAERRTVVVPDTARSARFSEHPRASEPTGIRFFAGVPLIAPDGIVLGALCAWDVRPHAPTADDIAILELLGGHAMALLELRRSTLRLDSQEALLAANAEVLEMIVEGAALPQILDTVALAVETSIPSTRCSILLLEAMVLRHGAGPSLPQSYRDAIDGVRIGPAVGSCGTSAFTRETVIVDDIAADPRWGDFRELALAAGLRACWSVPIIGRKDQVLGTFALYYDTVRTPTNDDLRQLSGWMNLAEVAISRAGDLAALRNAATFDALTGLMNRSQVLRLLAEETANPDSAIAVLFVDIDQFKFVNDTLGHAAGDQFLKVVADRLTECAGPDDTVARFGGDEFLLLCRAATHPGQAELLGYRIVGALQQPMSIYGHNFSLSVSVGIAIQSPQAGPSSTDLVGDADLAMYAAKRSGRNSVAMFNEDLRQQAAGRLMLDGELSQALSNGEMTCVYQPIVDIRSGRLMAVEALLRWNSPSRGQLAPRSFIPTAEDSGLIFALGEFVLRQACAQLARWRVDRAEWKDVIVRINVSPRQLRDDGFADMIQQILADAGLPATSLGLEVTESTFISDAKVARGILTRLRRLGVQVAIDDFGTGYSSLAQLKDLPADLLKIDREFVIDVNTDVAAAGIVEAILTLARTLGLQVVAEGIETDDQCRRLIELGCTVGQGFLWSRPVPAEVLGELVAGRSGRGHRRGVAGRGLAGRGLAGRERAGRRPDSGARFVLDRHPLDQSSAC